jgi:uncharacterized protein
MRFKSNPKYLSVAQWPAHPVMPGATVRCDDKEVSDAPQITDNQAASRFEYAAGEQVALLAYRLRGDRLVLVHAETPAELDGRGIGGALMHAAVDRAYREGLTVVPLCPFARVWLERHPEVAGQVKIDPG